MDRSFFVGSRIGFLFQRLRDKIDIFRTSGDELEKLGTLSNDILGRRLLESLCLPGKAFVDVGAHIGSVVDGVSRNSRPSAIVAIEAVPAKADRLRRRFPTTVVHECAAGEEDGEVPFYVYRKESGFSSLYASEERQAFMAIMVPVRRLDEIVEEQPVDMLKIIVEGAELGVLRGAKSLIERDQPTILFESGAGEMGGYTKVALWEWLDQAGYAVLVPNRMAHQDPGLCLPGFLEAHLYPRRTTIFFAVSRARRDELRFRSRTILRLDN